MLPKDWKQPMGSDRKLSCLHFLRWRRGCIWSIIWTVRCLFLRGEMCVEFLYIYIYLFLPTSIELLSPIMQFILLGGCTLSSLALTGFPVVSGFGRRLFAGMSHPIAGMKGCSGCVAHTLLRYTLGTSQIKDNDLRTSFSSSIFLLHICEFVAHASSHADRRCVTQRQKSS